MIDALWTPLSAAIARSPGDAKLDVDPPPVCHCEAFPWPHMRGVSRLCRSRVRRLGVIIDPWRDDE